MVTAVKGGGGCGQGGSNPIARSCAKLQKIAENRGKIVAPQPNLPKPQGATLLHRWLRMFLCLFKYGPQAPQLLQATLNITMELKLEPNAADIVIQFVLLLGKSATL